MDEREYKPQEAATHIGVSDQTIYNWIAAGIVKRFRAIGMLRKRYLIPESEVERLRREYQGEINQGNKFAPAA
jgi:excisionase family DNA binding protein